MIILHETGSPADLPTKPADITQQVEIITNLTTALASAEKPEVRADLTRKIRLAQYELARLKSKQHFRACK